ncbi:retinal guanylyl cyclase 2 isoform X1 [Cloeon dipterum]|uniref:retinal guanylyl cyclase 2 isoform X1 n=1 Tax=Cloeon dipterum TaxID=197152 RepID=UPI00322063DD
MLTQIGAQPPRWGSARVRGRCTLPPRRAQPVSRWPLAEREYPDEAAGAVVMGALLLGLLLALAAPRLALDPPPAALVLAGDDCVPPPTAAGLLARINASDRLQLEPLPDCRDASVLSVLLATVTNGRLIVAALPESLCPLAAALASVRGAKVLTWSCPHIEASPSFVSLVPGTAAQTLALSNLHRTFRWRRVVVVEDDTSEWSHEQARQLHMVLRAETVQVLARLSVSALLATMVDVPQCQVVILCVPIGTSAFSEALSMLSTASIGNPQILAFANPFVLHASAVHFSPTPGLSLPQNLLILAAVDDYPQIKVNSSHPQNDLSPSQFSLVSRLHEAAALCTSTDAPLITGLEGQAVRMRSNERLSHFLLLQPQWNDESGEMLWKPCVDMAPNGSTTIVSTPTWSCCEDVAQFTTLQIAAAVIVALVIVVTFSVGAVGLRRQLFKQKMSKGPYKVILTSADFVFPQVGDNRRVEAGIEAMLCCWLQHLQEFGAPDISSSDRPDLLQGSVASLRTAVASGPSSQASLRPPIERRARYNGDLVHLRDLQSGPGFELRNKALDVLLTLHGLRHENVAVLMGCLADPSRPCLVWEWASRGSLQDVLVHDDIKLDWSFRLSLLTDLVRGMRYLHASPIKVHGYLSSRNCVIDSRWVLKVTDYGLPLLLDAQGLQPSLKTARELLWTAPELLREPGLRRKGTQPGDVYSFGIITQEVVLRGEPFCTLNLTPEEILEKIKKPPPLIRPSVSKGAAPPEAINIMRQCWAENPEMRPTFVQINDLFKKLNHGRKVNIVDTMFQMLEKYSNNLEELIRERTEQLDMEKRKTEQLLNRMLPSSVAEKLKLGMPVGPEVYPEVTIYFSDIVGFTTISAYSSPLQVVELLNELYTCFDATINAYSVYKVETIGDAYMVVGGLPVRIANHASQIATMALDLLHQSGTFRIKHLPKTPLRLRIGLHSGSCCAGVVGLTMPRYCLFGDTVNTASRMESTGAAWRIHVSQETRDLLVSEGGYELEFRGITDIKGKGPKPTYWLLGKTGFNKELPTPPPLEESHGLDESLILSSLAEAPVAEETLESPATQEASTIHGSAPSLAERGPRLSQTTSAERRALWGSPEEDLSRAFNHYRCLTAGNGQPTDRRLRRQFSLDREDLSASRRSLQKQNSAGSPPRELARIEEAVTAPKSFPRPNQTTD